MESLEDVLTKRVAGHKSSIYNYLIASIVHWPISIKNRSGVDRLRARGIRYDFSFEDSE
jgi:hypothetical protein